MSAVDLSRFFPQQVHQQHTQQSQQPGWGSWAWGQTFGRVQRMAGAPVRGAAGAGAEGLADKINELFQAHQPEIVEAMRNTTTQALLQRVPDHYSQLIDAITSFRALPTQAALDRIQQLLPQLNDPQIRALCPHLLDPGVQLLTSLSATLTTNVHVLPGANPGDPNIIDVRAPAASALGEAEALLLYIKQSASGVVIQLLESLNQNLIDQNGLIQNLRQQLLHPQNGMVAQGMTQLRHELLSKVIPAVRESKVAMDGLKQALSSNPTSESARLHLEALQTKLTALIAHPEHIPQLSATQRDEINRFSQTIQGYICHPHMLPPFPTLLYATQPISQHLDGCFNTQRGMVDQFTDLLIEGIVAMPGRIMQEGSNNAASSQGQSFFQFDSLLQRGSQILNSVLQFGTRAVTTQALSSLAQLFHFSFTHFRDNIINDQGQQQLAQLLGPLIQRLDAAIQRGSGDELKAIIQDTIAFLRGNQVYFQGFRIPLNPARTHLSAIPGFFDNINTHRTTLQPPPSNHAQASFEEKFQKQCTILKARASLLFPIQQIAEKCLKISVTEQFRTEIFRIAPTDNPEKLPEIFRKRFFDKIDQTDRYFTTKWLFKRMFDFSSFFSRFYTSSILDNISKMALNMVKDDPQAPNAKQEKIVKTMHNWLAVTSGVYTQVAQSPPSRVKEFSSMMKEAHEDPVRNGGLNSKGLYTAVAMTALDTFGPKIRWTQRIDELLSLTIPENSFFRILNPGVKALNFITGGILKAFVFIPQFTGNFILRQGAKLTLSHTDLLQQYSEAKIESLRRNTPTAFAMQKMIYTQMQKLLATIQQKLRDDSDEMHDSLVRDTNISRLGISNLIESGLEVLNKSQYNTPERLQNFLRNRASLRDTITNSLQENFLTEILSNSVAIVSITLKSMTNETEAKSLLYDSFAMANDSFSSNEGVSDEEFASLERGIRELNDQIIETAILHAVEKKFDFTNERQRRDLQQFMQNAKDQTQQFTTAMHESAHYIHTLQDHSPEQYDTRIANMIRLSTAFNQGRVDALSRADGNRNFHASSKNELNLFSRDQLNHCNHITPALNTMKTLSNEMCAANNILKPLLSIQNTLTALRGRGNLSEESLAFCATQVSAIKTQIAQIDSAPADLIASLNREIDGLSQTLTHIKNQQAAKSLLPHFYPMFQYVKGERIQCIAAPASLTLKEEERRLLHQISLLALPEQKQQLKAALQSYMQANTAQDIYAKERTFIQCLSYIDQQNTLNLQQNVAALSQRQQNFQSFLTTKIHSQQRLIQEKKDLIIQNLHNVSAYVGDMNNWIQPQNGPILMSVTPFDMNWVSENVKNVAFSAVQSKCSILFDSLYKDYNYTGFVHQAIFLPFLRAYGKNHLKN